jgi:hypothetical protein
MPPKKPTKAQTRAHDAISAAAREKGIQIRYARSIKSPGALCQVKDKLILFVKRSLDIDDQTAIMQAELERFEKEGVAAVNPGLPAGAEPASLSE